MKSKFEIQKYKASDEKQVIEIVKKTWFYEKMSDQKIANEIAKVYLTSILLEETFTRVAKVGDKIVGIIMLKDSKKDIKINFQLSKNMFLGGIKIYINKEGRRILKAFSKMGEIDKTLFKKANKSFDGEVSFFVVDEEYRGKGIGKLLFDAGIEYFKQNNMKNFYLYTDSCCNFGFYDHRGLKCLAKRTSVNLLDRNSIIESYLYEGMLSEL
ncbi:MAG: GNAT family N-acetyltransferase [Sarcina sp.]